MAELRAETRTQRPEYSERGRYHSVVSRAQRARRREQNAVIKCEQNAGSRQGEQANKVSESGAQTASKVSKRTLSYCGEFVPD